ncbi:hypothetical protein B6A10_09110 [Flavobacterium sp. L1I52]|uniref:DUF433 domain-containing protein n=1 Tax=Flavobacterium pokkalii TaxID=1940408 RepID=A0ABR7UR35_9FLAO|nr:DUF433 domain-containing protein [Flavobacterium pokkalii]KQB44544.1 protein containing DUF433 domain [Flavobacterium daejeonense]MBD0725336.1 hypothetical protein [Flavobacterium pokkalii]
MIDYKQYITINSETRFGKPSIIGTRITVFDVLNWLANGMSFEDIIEDFPELNENQIRACLSYAADREHKIQIAS